MTSYHSDDYMMFLKNIRPDNITEYNKQMQRFNVGEVGQFPNSWKLQIFLALTDLCSNSFRKASILYRHWFVWPCATLLFSLLQNISAQNRKSPFFPACLYAYVCFLSSSFPLLSMTDYLRPNKRWENRMCKRANLHTSLFPLTSSQVISHRQYFFCAAERKEKMRKNE